MRDELDNRETMREKGMFTVDVEECVLLHALFSVCFLSIIFVFFSHLSSRESRYKQIEEKKL